MEETVTEGEIERYREEEAKVSCKAERTIEELHARQNDAIQIFDEKEKAREIAKQNSIDANKCKQRIEEEARKAAEKFDRDNISEEKKDDWKRERTEVTIINNDLIAEIAELQKTIGNRKAKTKVTSEAQELKKKIENEIAANNEYAKKKTEFDKKWNDIRNTARNEASKAAKLSEQADAESAKAKTEAEGMAEFVNRIKGEADDAVREAVGTRKAAETRDAAAKEAIFGGLTRAIANKDHENNRVLQEMQEFKDRRNYLINELNGINHRQTEIGEVFAQALHTKKGFAMVKSKMEEELNERDIALPDEQKELERLSKELDDYKRTEKPSDRVIKHKEECIKESESCIEELNKEIKLSLELLATESEYLDEAGGGGR
ncbi:hypothetical protein AGMMS49592_5120 [Endomicrobiia bacterium]|nr:hypothetical protein AGMMS49592_5120 [Endomicrobiia bacterium]